jgi:hypothetical protein
MLVQTLEELMRGDIDISTACKRAYELAAGQSRQSGVGRVLSPLDEVLGEVRALNAAIAPLSLENDPKKWAGTMLIFEVWLGMGDIKRTINGLLNVCEISGGRCPDAARPFVSAMFQSVLARLPPGATGMAQSLSYLHAGFMARATNRAMRSTIWNGWKDLRWLWGLFGSLVGGPSILSLLQAIFVSHRLTPVLQELLDAYNRLLALIAVQIEPSILLAVDWITQRWDLSLALQTHWRAIFALSLMTVVADIRSNWNAGVYLRMLIYGTLGLLGALAGCVIAGLTPLDHGWWAHGLIAAAPRALSMLALTTSMTIEASVVKNWMTPLESFRRHLWRTIVLSVTAFALGAGLWFVPGLQTGAGILALLLMTLWTAIDSARSGLRAADESALRYGLTLGGGFALAFAILIADTLIKQAQGL